ncbi:MAG: Regulatory sensor-transducer, BlaR1/MecR1 family, partial [Acidobacteria bacterium]|nr:Regulatory sensor-transducer, BlaR1/MecR1 family [Acidobacteriota bacterium]
MRRALIALAGALVAAIALADIRGTWTIERSSRIDGNVQLNLSRDHNHFGSNFPIASFSGLSLADGASQFELRAEAGTIRFDGTFRDGDGAGHFTFASNPKFAGTLRSMNVREIGDVDDEKLLQLALHGVSTDFIRAMRAEGYDVTLEKYVSMRIFHVTPDVIHELRALGFDKLSYDDLIASRVHRVTPDYIRSMRAAGYSLSMDQLLASRVHRADPEFAIKMRDLGYPNMKFDDMIAFR